MVLRNIEEKETGKWLETRSIVLENTEGKWKGN